MKAIDIRNQTLLWTDLPSPEPKAKEVLIQVRATAINRADLIQRTGRYNPPQGASKILGLEAAGIVIQIGDEVTQLKVGDRVSALLTGGGYAEKVCAHEGHCFLIPNDWSFTYAAAIPEVFITAYVNLFEEGNLGDQGDAKRALIWAAASGVGTAALQLCQHRNIKVGAICSATKHDALKGLGVETLFDRKDPDLFTSLKASGRYDMILDPVGTNINTNLSLLNRRGRLVIIGLLGLADKSKQEDLPLGRLLVNRLSIIGSVLRSRSDEEKAAIIKRFKQDFWGFLEDKSIAPIIDSTFSILDAEKGHQHVASNTTVGKVILDIP